VLAFARKRLPKAVLPGHLLSTKRTDTKRPQGIAAYPLPLTERHRRRGGLFEERLTVHPTLIQLPRVASIHPVHPALAEALGLTLEGNLEASIRVVPDVNHQKSISY